MKKYWDDKRKAKELERELKEKDISEQSTAELAHKIGAYKDNIGRILERYSYKGKSKGS